MPYKVRHLNTEHNHNDKESQLERVEFKVANNIELFRNEYDPFNYYLPCANT